MLWPDTQFMFLYLNVFLCQVLHMCSICLFSPLLDRFFNFRRHSYNVDVLAWEDGQVFWILFTILFSELDWKKTAKCDTFCHNIFEFYLLFFTPYRQRHKVMVETCPLLKLRKVVWKCKQFSSVLKFPLTYDHPTIANNNNKFCNSTFSNPAKILDYRLRKYDFLHQWIQHWRMLFQYNSFLFHNLFRPIS